MMASNRTPEDVSFEIGSCFVPVDAGMDLDPAEQQVFACLRAHRAEIANAEREFRITRLAIAGRSRGRCWKTNALGPIAQWGSGRYIIAIG